MTLHQATVDVSSESSAASGGPGLLNHDPVRGWMSGADGVDGWGSQVGMQWDSARFHHTSQNGLQLKTLKLFLSRVFHLIFSDHS